MLDDSNPQGALSFQPPVSPTVAQTISISDPNHPQSPPTTAFKFSIPAEQGVLQSASFSIAAAAGTGAAKTFQLALYEWDGSAVVGGAIYTTPLETLPANNQALTGFLPTSLNIPVDAQKQYVWEVVADGNINVSSPPMVQLAPALTTTGELPFTDVNDTHSVSVAAGQSAWAILSPGFRRIRPATIRRVKSHGHMKSTRISPRNSPSAKSTPIPSR